MDLYLQCGWGMMDLTRHFVEKWGSTTAVLSPRDQDDRQLLKLASEVLERGGSILLDPQFYLPHSEHPRILAHDYWPQNYNTAAFWSGPHLDELLNKLSALNTMLHSTGFILPGLLATQVDGDWLETQKIVLEHARTIKQELPLILTIALSADALRSEDQISLLLENAQKWLPNAYYLVCEHPNGDYLVKDPSWLANVLDLTAGLRLTGAKVILGYCNHQMLIVAASKVNAICSGTWMNVRSFPPAKFDTAEEEIKQKSTWYYCPQLLSEYKIPYLDIARRQGLLDTMLPPNGIGGDYASALFSGAQPSSVNFGETDAFKHYLKCLKHQSASANQATFDDTITAHERLLTTAENLLAQMRRAGIVGQNRDFQEIIDVNRAALSGHVATRGPILRRKWATL